MKYLVTNPLNYFFALLILTYLVCSFTRLKWYWKTLPVLGLLLASFSLTPIGANTLSGYIASDAAPEQCNTDVAIIVADSWRNIPKANTDFGVLYPSTLMQIDSAKHWLLQGDNRKVVISAPTAVQQVNSKALILNYAIASGIAAEQIVLSESDGSPADAAMKVGEAIETKKVTVIDSELKMLRNARAFEEQGFSVCSLVSEKNAISAHALRMIAPSSESVALSQQALWEAVGLVWYWWEGKI